MERIAFPGGQASAHDRIYAALAKSSLFQHILVHAMSADYPTGSTQYSFVGMSALSWLADRLRSAPVGLTVDAGCGDGSLTQWLSDLSTRPMIGLDTSTKAIELATSRSTPGCEYVLANFCRMPLALASVSAVTALDCVQHATTPAFLAAELSRVCKSGARVLFTHWIPLLAPEKLEHRDPLCAALVSCGFRIKEAVDIDPSLAYQFRFYGYVHANRELIRHELGDELYGSLMYEAQHLHARRGKVGHMAVLAIKH